MQFLKDQLHSQLKSQLQEHELAEEFRSGHYLKDKNIADT